MGNFTCPFAIKLRYFKWSGARTALGCSARKVDGKDYKTMEAEKDLLCGSQYYCQSCGKMKNTPLASQCYEAMKKQKGINS